MLSKNKTTTARWVSEIATWLSSGFLSIVVLAACLIPALWFLGLDVAVLQGGPLDTATACELAICLSVVIGVSTFLSNYILLGHPTAYVGSLFAICSIGVFTNRTIFVLAVSPIIIGSFAGYYLNRYTKYRSRQIDRSTTLEFVCVRFMCAFGASLLTMALLEGQSHWSIYMIWIVKLCLYLAFSFRGIWQRSETQIAR